jgi:hypothetical protein
MMELPAVPLAAPAQPAASACGSAPDLPQARGRHHPGADHLLWFLSSFPGRRRQAPPAGHRLQLGRPLGRALEVVFAPIGFNWQICIALVPGLAAREVAVSALATVYALSATGDDGRHRWAPLIAEPGAWPPRCRCWPGSCSRRSACPRCGGCGTEPAGPSVESIALKLEPRIRTGR